MNRNETQRLIKNSKKWIEAYDQLLYGLKEVGDLANWSQMIDQEMANVTAMIEFKKSPSAEGKMPNN